MKILAWAIVGLLSAIELNLMILSVIYIWDEYFG